jgi:UDP-N-acetylmuramoyl-L-alanyl-D-glutamate--2,6-diaminopimelate ligase
MTSPDPFDLQKFLRQAKNAGCTTLVLEVSSHALFYDRIHGIDFDIVALTNISQDHLDLH